MIGLFDSGLGGLTVIRRVRERLPDVDLLYYADQAHVPYGERTDPIEAFDFEEFTPQAGLSGMLWGNSAVVAGLLLGATFSQDGSAMKPGSVAYFPEGTYYGPQSCPTGSETLVLQFGGASLSGYISAEEHERASAELAEHGTFAFVGENPPWRELLDGFAKGSG